MRIQKVFLLLVAISAVRVSADCGSAPNCQACVEIPLCGWCSVPVTYTNGQNGPQCAGFANGSKPFVCDGVYSTNTCQQGYVCDVSTGICSLGQPGTGLPLPACQAACHKSNTSVYLCDKTTKVCNVVPSGTPGSSSYEICEAICKGIPTPSPGPVQLTYICNISTWQCQATTPGHGASLLVCQQECNASNPQYICNPTTDTCDEVPPLTPGCMPLTQCEQICANFTPAPIPPNPGPPPEYIGTWRGVEIQNGYAFVEYDILINNTIAIFTVHTQTTKTTFSGTPYHIPNSQDLEMWIVISQGPGTGQTLRTIGDTSGANGPQTTFGTMAMAALGQRSPKSITAAMTDGNSTVLALAKCITGNPFCIFTMSSPFQEVRRKALLNAKKSSIEAMNAVLKQKKEAMENHIAITARGGLAANDQCSQYDTACSVCLQHNDCGWCSVPVTYSDGTKGTQCAGFQGNSTAFVCPGYYTTSSCEVGYICTSGTFQCVATQPGDGMPQAVCLQTCIPTPPPAPRPTEYTCNIVTKQCVLCPGGQCPGSMPLVQCETLCPHRRAGPTPDMIGTWRGIYIENQYNIGELDLVLNAQGGTFYKYGVFNFHATIISLGPDVMIFTIDKGPNTGSTFGALYQMAQQDFGMYWQATFAFGALNQPFPADYNTAMYSHGMKEAVLAACLKAPCTFPTPSA